MSEESFYFLRLLGADDGQTLRSVFIDSTPVNTPLSGEMQGRPLYTVCLTPDWSSRMFGMMCSRTLDLSSRLSGTICSDRME